MRTIRALVLCLLPSLAGAQPLVPVQILHEFTSAPWWPDGGLVQVPDGSFYGVTVDAIYRVAPGGQVTIAGRITDGTFAHGTLAIGPDGALYGTTRFGGSGGIGTVFRFDPASGAVRTLHAFDGATDGFGEPVGGLALAGGFFYGVTRTQLFKVDPATGATSTQFVFSATAGPQIFDPSSPLTVGADGLLYGTTAAGPGTGLAGGVLYRFDPATSGTVSVRHAFADGVCPGGRLRLGGDGRLYGSAVCYGLATGGAVYRFDPATAVFDVLNVFPPGPLSGPGPVVIAADGSLYGTTAASNQVVPNKVSVLFRLRPGAGGYTYEALRTFDDATSGLSDRAELALGTDGLIYGYSQYGGPASNGTVYRFDPAEGGAAPDPLAFTVLHAFAPATTWGPSAPVPGGTGLFYGTTSRGGAAQRGAIYALNPSTGEVTIPAFLPGTTALSMGWNSSLTPGFDGALYGTSVMATATTIEHAIVRFVPATNTVTIPQVTSRPRVGDERPVPDSPMVWTASGDLYFMRGRFAMRYVPSTGALTTIGETPDPTATVTTTTAPVATLDGRIYVVVETAFVTPPTGTRFVRLMRIDPVANTFEVAATLGSDVAMSGGLVLANAATGGNLFVGGAIGNASTIRRIDPDTGAHPVVCTFPDNGLQYLSVAPIGSLVGVTTYTGPQKLQTCFPSPSGSFELTAALPHAIGAVSSPFVSPGTEMYGATWDRPFTPLVPRSGPAPVQPGGALIRLLSRRIPPFLDTDGDALPSEWETTYGLDPFSATADSGATGDPDGDGRTNAQELAAGTHPRGFVSRYFAEGATGPFFRTRLDVANPTGASTATVLVRFLTDTGGLVVQHLVVAPMSHVSLDLSTLMGLTNATFSTVIESDAMIAVERTMTWDPSGYGSHIETGIAAPATTWYLAEGSTSGPFSLFYLLQNPQAVPIDATVRYLLPGGLPPIERTYTLLPNSRRTIVVDGEGAELASTDVSAVITAGAPIVAERAMYYSQPNQAFAAGHESAGVTAPALEWFFAEGATGVFFDLFVLIANPGTAAATVEVEYLLIGGGSLTKTYTVPGNARTTIWVDDEELPAASGQKPLADVAVSMRVRSTNGVPIVAERTMWWPGPLVSPAFWYEAHNSPGATASALRWVVAGGDIGGPAGAQTYVLIANPGAAAGQARITALTANGRTHIGDVPLPAKSRTNVPFTGPGAFGLDGPFSILVESIGVAPVPIVVEQATYASPGGVLWGAGGNALAAPIP